jgi:protein SCO1/2
MTQRLWIVLVVSVALVAGVYTAWKVQPFTSQEPEYFQIYQQPRPLTEVALVDQFDQPFGMDKLTGKWTLTFIGYTFCPDVCPTTLSELNAIYPALKAMEEDVPIQVMFMSVDPGRDTPERMKEYVDFFNPEFIGVSGPHKILFPLTRRLGLGYALTDPTDDPEYLVNHSASIVLINPEGVAIGRFKPRKEEGQLPVGDGQQIVHDMPAIMTSL